MKVAARRSGLSPHVIRVWERRYGAIRPARSETKRRLFSDEELARLEHLAFLTKAGHSISQIASLPDEELEAMRAEEAIRDNGDSSRASAEAGESFDEWIAPAIEAVKNFDAEALTGAFDKAAVTAGYSGLLERVIIPVIHRIGEEWDRGTITAAEEHAASACIRDYLARLSESHQGGPDAPNLIATTPAGQMHELGAIVVAAVARKLGWNVTYLGASLPAEEIAGAAIRNHSKAVALSIVYPPDDPNLPSEIERLRHLLPAEIPILTGGRAVEHYAESLGQVGARVITGFSGLRDTLEDLRKLA